MMMQFLRIFTFIFKKLHVAMRILNFNLIEKRFWDFVLKKIIEGLTLSLHVDNGCVSNSLEEKRLKRVKNKKITRHINYFV
jgi:hypothetical protein